MVFKNTFELKFSSCCNNYYIVHSRYVEVLDKNIFCTISGKVLLPKIIIKHNSALYVFNQSWKGVCLPQRAHIYYLWYINKTHANKSRDLSILIWLDIIKSILLGLCLYYTFRDIVELCIINFIFSEGTFQSTRTDCRDRNCSFVNDFCYYQKKKKRKKIHRLFTLHLLLWVSLKNLKHIKF